MAKKIFALLLVVATLWFFVDRTLNYGSTISTRDETALRQFHMEYNSVHH